MSLFRLTFVLMTCFLSGVGTLAADWPVFRGDALQTGVAAKPLSDNLKVLWKFQAQDAVEGTAAIVGDVAYVASLDEHLYALRLSDGQELWRHKATFMKASPAVKDGRVFVGDTDGTFHCVDAATGKQLWTFITGNEIISSANFAGDKVIFGSYDEFLYCLDAQTGKLVWKFQTQGPVNAAPAVVEGRTFAAGCDAMLRVVNVDDGKEVAAVDLAGQAGASAAVSGDLVYVGNMDKTLLAIDWKKGELAWHYEHPKRKFAFYSSAAVHDGVVVVGGRDRQVHGVNAKTGELLWAYMTRGKVDSSPVIAGDRAYIGSADGNLYCFQIRTGEKLGEYALGSTILASPAVHDGKLVIGTEDGIVYCLGGS